MKRPMFVSCVFAALTLPAAPGSAIDLENGLVVRWHEVNDESVRLLKELGATAVIVRQAKEQPSDAVKRACETAGLTLVLEIGPFAQWDELEKEFAVAVKHGYRAVIFEAVENSARRIRKLAAAYGDVSTLVLLKPEWAAWQIAPALAVLNDGRWPGLEPRDPSVANASEAPWINANCHLFGYLSGMFPERPAVLSYLPDEKAGVSKSQVVHFDSVELSLAEAIAAGGNVILAFPDNFRASLAAKRPKALEAWRSLLQTAAMLRSYRDRLRQPLSSDVTVVGGDLEQTAEVLNMFFRRNLSPRTLVAEQLAPESVSGSRVLVVANVAPPPPAGQRVIANFANRGGVVMLAPARNGEKSWWTPAGNPEAREQDRDVYAVGKGRIALYKEPVIDTAEFAWDVTDSIGALDLDLRLWNAPTVLGLMRRQKDGAAFVVLLNYGSALTRQEDDTLLMRIRGDFKKAELVLPGARPPIPVKAKKRGATTEVEVRGLERIAIVDLH